MYNTNVIIKQNNMEKERKYIFVVSAMNVTTDNDGIIVKVNNTTHSYFSCKEKAQIHIDWLKEVAKNNKSKEIMSTEFHGRYELDNGEQWIIQTEKCLIDADDLLTDEY